jgi:hypothetical protein
MMNTDLLDQPRPDLATGYHRAPDEDTRELMIRAGRTVPDEATVDGINIRHEFTPEWGGGAAGGVQSTIPDMARYAAALLNHGSDIVRRDTFAEMVSPQWAPHPDIQSWGWSFAVRRSFGRRSFGHGGNALGWNSHLSVFAEEAVAVIIHTNVTFPRFGNVVQRIKQAVLDAPTITVEEKPITPDLMASVAGVYEAPVPGPLTNFRVATETGRIQLSASEGGVFLHSRRGHWKHGVRILAGASPDSFILDTGDPEPPQLAFVRDAEGTVTGIHLSDGNPWYLQRAENVQPWV